MPEILGDDQCPQQTPVVVVAVIYVHWDVPDVVIDQTILLTRCRSPKLASKESAGILLEIFGDDYIEFGGEVYSHITITLDAYTGQHPANPLLSTHRCQFSRATMLLSL